MTSLVIIAVVQIFLGNPFAVLTSVATGVTMTIPIAMTCGAAGAMFHGLKALSEDERISSSKFVSRRKKTLELSLTISAIRR
jgi:hypothetical protein